MFATIISFASLAVEGWGAALAIIGIINFSEGHSQQNAAKKEEGMGKIVGGAIIFAVGVAVVPLLSQFLSV
ncbi:MAG: Maff2 family protein [Clostridium sp.]|nr:Maff2 family protein [Clostridium sp.]